jgi:hypothetical protein
MRIAERNGAHPPKAGPTARPRLEQEMAIPFSAPRHPLTGAELLAMTESELLPKEGKRPFRCQSCERPNSRPREHSRPG